MNKINNKGQSLIMFIIFLPIILMTFALIVDVAFMYHAKIKGNDLLKFAKKENLDIKEYFKLNDINVENIETSRNDKGSCVIINYKIDSIFGSLIGYKDYEVEITDC